MTIERGSEHAPAVYDEYTVMAFRALSAGLASADQQKHVLDWTINQASRLYDMSYRPNDALAMAFAEGRRFVGSQVVKMMHPKTLEAAKKQAPAKSNEAKND